ncbi:enoyl-CoA hydratase/isomerase family protein [Sediminicoccus rosea]|jgi:enoyl-CoA hydratase/carnithine racemase|uniref:Enoyl-CoA hydratase/isomerase family protein n=1 Tax=Sediminicoccus rosea TaxID=1225128 RepID=A0ABZ0PG77_9PROT|nr:enoyl-CoA hydratase/isomerase family protein [Sediminicoccus rosea]WPB84654.1 enoyl-CoA hydratase/isomerase family protein [Sediminicoccus rosea]
MSSSATDPGLREERAGRALLLTLDRPAAGNALDEATILALRARLDHAARDETLNCVILCGTGRFFCAGGDLKAYRALENAAALERVFGAARALLDAIEAHPLPVIAAIDGYALGGGAELALACDLRVAGAGAVLGFPQLRLGIIPGWDGTERLAARVGRGTAMRLLLTGERLTAEAAQAMGLVELVAENAREAALRLAADLEAAAPLAIRGAKQALSTLELPRAEARNLAAGVFARLWFTEDHREAERAFAEKREAVFHGR